MKKILFIPVMLVGLLICMLVLLPMAAMANNCDYVYVTGEADLSGTNSYRTSANAAQITGTSSWATEGNFIIDWNITKSITGLYTYEYEITAKGNGGGLSNWIMQVSPGIKFETGPTGNFAKLEGPQWWEKSGNDTLPSPIYGVKFDSVTSEMDVTKFTFTTYHMPVWGDFFAKGGQTEAYNTGINIDPCNAGGNYQGYIVVADSVVPLPGAVLLLGAGMARLVAYARRRQE